jgi:CRISPR/Cas system CSM-associated protein Csm5 (group 7 of RAMP superfamily)
VLKIHELLPSFEWKLNREKIPLQFLSFGDRFSVDVKKHLQTRYCVANENLRCGVAKFFENLANAVLLGTVYLS